MEHIHIDSSITDNTNNNNNQSNIPPATAFVNPKLKNGKRHHKSRLRNRRTQKLSSSSSTLDSSSKAQWKFERIVIVSVTTMFIFFWTVTLGMFWNLPTMTMINIRNHFHHGNNPRGGKIRGGTNKNNNGVVQGGEGEHIAFYGPDDDDVTTNEKDDDDDTSHTNLGRNNKSKISDTGSTNGRKYNVDTTTEGVDMALLQLLPFPQSIRNEDWETIIHPAVQTLNYLKPNRKNINKKKEPKPIKIPSFWNPIMRINAAGVVIKDIRTYLGNYGETLPKVQNAKSIGSKIVVPCRGMDAENEILKGDAVSKKEDTTTTSKKSKDGPSDDYDGTNYKGDVYISSNDPHVLNKRIPNFIGSRGNLIQSNSGKSEKVEEILPNDDDEIFTPTCQVETIYVMIASYRDPRCTHTLEMLFKHATYPERIRVGIVDQLEKGDVPCFALPADNGDGLDNLEASASDSVSKSSSVSEDEESSDGRINTNDKEEAASSSSTYCRVHPNHIYCKYSHLIDVFTMDASASVGPVFARHIGARLYRGEYYSMQIDAHMELIKGWDVDIVQQWKATTNEMAVLTTYVSDVTNHYDFKTGSSSRKVRPLLCDSKFFPDYYNDGPAVMMHDQEPEYVPYDVVGEPTLTPFWGGGFSFARGHFTIQVPYDLYLPQVFQGEEINIGVRGFTYGYDFYAPERSVIFHYYTNSGDKGGEEGKKKKKKEKNEKGVNFWDNEEMYVGVAKESKVSCGSFDYNDYNGIIILLLKKNFHSFISYFFFLYSILSSCIFFS